MKAYYSTAYGGPDVSHLGDLPDPVPDNKQVLVEVKAVSLNPVDYKAKRGDLKFLTGSKFPKIFGSDFAGIIKDTGKEDPDFKPGDRVYGVAAVIFGKQGALSQFLAVDRKNVWPIPIQMTFEEAASLPIGALTAMNGLNRTGVTEGTRLLINGGTGGVGHFATQIAKARGAVVTVTCSAANAGFAKSLGADTTMEYSPEAFASYSQKFDAILDAYGHMDLKDAMRMLNKGGNYASTMLNPFVLVSSLFIRIITSKKLTSANLSSKPSDREELERLFMEKKLHPVIENMYTLDTAAEAFEFAEKGKPRGKIIVRI